MCAFGLHLAFPLTAWWWLAPIAIAGLVASWCSLAPRPAALAGFASGLVFFGFGFSWFGETAGALVGPAAPILDLGPAAVEALAFAFAAVVTSFAARRCEVHVVPFVAAAAFALGEQLRSSGVLGVPLEQIGIAMIDSPLRPLAAFIGGYGLTFVTALVGASLGWWLLSRGDVRRLRAMIAVWGSVVACTALAWSAWPARHAAPPTRRVAAVQGGIAQTLKMSPQGLMLAIDRYTRMTEQLASAHPQLVLWPETVITADYDTWDGVVRLGLNARFARLAQRLRTTLVVGTLRTVPGDDVENALKFYDPRGVAFATYGKEQLVPFAEYIPGPAWLRALPYADQIGIYHPARNAAETIAGATPLICWEANFGDLAHARLKDDPTLFIIATDDAWFGTTEGPYEEAQAATLRAVETGRWILRAGATGVSGIVAPDGTWTQRTALGTSATVIGDVGAPAPGPYARIGTTPVGYALALAIAVPLLLRRRT